MTIPEIARAMFVSPNTTKTHVKSIYRKLGVKRRHELAEKVGQLAPAEVTP